ncbi:MAG TPA: TonB family protein [Candidatus Methylacidiphilales bacterium]|jgi:protein TonB|nr:TonB family protein [Candidatus Methylacidiphilales bacterium]
MKLPHLTPHNPHAKAVWARRHPKEHLYVGRSVALSVAIHVIFGAMVCLLAWWLDHVVLSHSSSTAQSGPAPEQAMTVNLVMTDVHRPPPPAPAIKPTPEPGLPVLPVQPVPKPSVATIVPPPPVPAPAPAPKPATPILTQTKAPTPAPSPARIAAKPGNKPRPKYVAAHATGQGKAPEATSAQLATLGYPAPNYPLEALNLHEVGTVLMEVAFGPDGKVAHAAIRKSSGYSILDFSTQSFIRIHWKDLSRANTTIDVPIMYSLENRAARSFP